MEKYFSPTEKTIARGKLAIIEALEGKMISVAGHLVTINDGQFNRPTTEWPVLLSQYEIDTLERWLRATEDPQCQK